MSITGLPAPGLYRHPKSAFNCATNLNNIHSPGFGVPNEMDILGPGDRHRLLLPIQRLLKPHLGMVLELLEPSGMPRWVPDMMGGEQYTAGAQ